MGNSEPMFSSASVLFRVTTVGFETTLVLFCVLSAETMTLKSDAEKTAEVRRLVPPVLVRPSSWSTALLAEFAMPVAIVSVIELLVPLEVLLEVPLLVPEVEPLEIDVEFVTGDVNEA